MRLIVGLGNPGAAYAGNRHNVGFHCLDVLATRHCLRFSRQQSRALIAEGQIGGEPVRLVKPQTYMNLSGDAVAPLLRFYKLEPADLVVVLDDLDLPLGRLRVRAEGGWGGHHGLQSIAEQLGTKAFPRIRIGVGRPAEDTPGVRHQVVEHVLSDFSRDELPVIRDAVERAADAVEMILREGIETAMNHFNR